MLNRRGLVAGLGLLMVGGLVMAAGCAARTREAGEEAGEARAAVKCNGCPYDEVVTTANYAPPHAYPGPCYGPGDEGQADYDGATEELWWECQSYCGQSEPACGDAAQVVNLQCIDRDIGHRWSAYCICGD
jgi:hypothetical protein